MHEIPCSAELLLPFSQPRLHLPNADMKVSENILPEVYLRYEDGQDGEPFSHKKSESLKHISRPWRRICSRSFLHAQTFLRKNCILITSRLSRLSTTRIS
jgi:hypothetical protein